MRINNDFIIVGVDAGYGNMKTANTIFSDRAGDDGHQTLL